MPRTRHARNSALLCSTRFKRYSSTSSFVSSAISPPTKLISSRRLKKMRSPILWNGIERRFIQPITAVSVTPKSSATSALLKISFCIQPSKKAAGTRPFPTAFFRLKAFNKQVEFWLIKGSLLGLIAYL